MLLFVWFWATASAFLPATTLSAQTPLVETQRSVAEAAARPLMALGWVDEDEAPIF